MTAITRYYFGIKGQKDETKVTAQYNQGSSDSPIPSSHPTSVLEVSAHRVIDSILRLARVGRGYKGLHEQFCYLLHELLFSGIEKPLRRRAGWF